MSDVQDIRMWAVANGIDIGQKGPIPKGIREQYSAQQPSADTLDGAPDGAEPAPLESGAVPEPPPAGQAKRPWWRPPSRSEPDAPKPSKRRVSIESLVSTAWSAGAMLAAPRALPVARVLDMQAPVAGIIINDAARGTAVDAVLQPIARAGEKGEKMMALLGPPMLTAAICNKPELYPLLRPVLKISIISWMQISEPAMKKAEKRQKDFAGKFGDVDIDAMIDALFMPPPGMTAPEPEQQAAA